MLRKVNIAGLTMDPASNTPIIILKTEDDEQAVPIWIGLLEATSIASALQKIKYERPMTHDLFKNFAETQNISIERVEVCDLRDNTFFARIHFVAEGGQSFDMDARPSDAIALALRFASPDFRGGVRDPALQDARPGRGGGRHERRGEKVGGLPGKALLGGFRQVQGLSGDRPALQPEPGRAPRFVFVPPPALVSPRAKIHENRRLNEHSAGLPGLRPRPAVRFR